MNAFRKWLITRLGGVVREGAWCTFKSDYWNEECVQTSIYVQKESYKESTVQDIENELVRKLGSELLNKGLVCFSDMNLRDNSGDIQVSCQTHALKFKNHQPYHMPSRLSTVYERRRRNE